MQGAAMYAGSAMPTKNQSSAPNTGAQTSVSQNYREAPAQNNYTTPSWYGNQTVQDNTPMQQGNTINLQPNKYSTWGSW